MTAKRGHAKHKSVKAARARSHSRHIVKHEKSHKKAVRHISPPQKIEEMIKKAPHELEEEFFLPSPVHRGKYHIPLGIKFLIGYLAFLAVLYVISFIYGITFPTTILFGKMITGARAMIINVVLVLLILFMIFGFWKRKAYTFDLSIGFFSFAALNAVISLVLFESSENPVFRKLLLLSFVSLIIMNIIVVWYILHERKYFYAYRFTERAFHHRDKVFLYLIVTFWVLTLLIGLTLGFQFYKDTTKMIDSIILEMRGDYYTGAMLCEKKAGTEKDICNLIVATAMSTKHRPQSEMVELCKGMESDFYKFTCMRSISH